MLNNIRVIQYGLGPIGSSVPRHVVERAGLELVGGMDIAPTKLGKDAEGLSFPWLAYPEEVAEVDAAAKEAGKTVLRTGVNPGFLMDSLPLSLTAICQRVDHISVTRLMNASLRRGPFQAKIGSGMTVEDFSAKIAAGRMGHVSLPESVGMVFDTLVG
jgi:hypothetical protein